MFIVLFLQCERSKNDINNLKARYDYDNASFTERINNKGHLVAKQKQIITNSKRTIKELVENVNGLRKVNQQIKTKIKVVVDTVLVPAIDTVVIDKNKGLHWLKLPQRYGVENKYYSVFHTIDTSGNSYIDKIDLTLSPVITLGYEDNGFIGNIIKKRKPIINFDPGSPHARVVDMSNIKYEKKKSNAAVKVGVIMAAFIIGAAL